MIIMYFSLLVIICLFLLSRNNVKLGTATKDRAIWLFLRMSRTKEYFPKRIYFEFLKHGNDRNLDSQYRLLNLAFRTNS